MSLARVAAMVLVLLAGGYLVHWGGELRLQRHLLTADANQVAQTPDLRRFAMDVAKPAYLRNCAGCHGTDLEGDSARGIPALGRGGWLYGTGHVSEIERTIAYGIRSGQPKSWNLADMPAFARENPYSRYKIASLMPDEINDLVEFLLSLDHGQDHRQADADASRRGRDIFAGKGQCFDCHLGDASGDPAIGAPSLRGPTWLYGHGTRSDLFKSIAQGHRGICPGWSGRLEPATIRALAVYVQTRGAALGAPRPQ